MRSTLRLPPHSGTSAHVCAAYPWQLGSGLPGAGAFLGYDHQGGVFCFDPWELYSRRRLTNPNIIVLGQLGRGKSALVKTLLARNLAFGRQAWIIDPKGEYGAFSQIHGLPIIRLQPGGATRVNPLEAGPASGSSIEELARRRAALVGALAETTMHRRLEQVEAAALDALCALLAPDAVMADVVGGLLDPDEALAVRLAGSRVQVADEVRPLGLALQRLANGALAGMFDSPTNIEIDWSGRGMTLDLSAIWADQASLPLVLTCALAWLQVVLSQPGPQRFLVLDEAWALLHDVATARWLRGASKLSRAWGLSVVFVLHRLSDLDAAGASESEQAQLARGLLSDTGTRVVFGSASNEVASIQELLRLTATEADLLPRLERGSSLWLVGDQSHVLHHVVDSSELAFVDTDAAMRGERPVEPAP